MHPKQSKKTKRPRSAQQPFPWQCYHCGKREVTLAKTDYAAEVQHDGRLHRFTVADLELPVCQACGERVFTEKVDSQVNDALRAYLKLLTPTQIRGAIKRVGMSQKDLAKCLGIAEATLSRWLSEVQIQSRSMDNLLRLFFAFPDVRDVLCGGSEVLQLGLSDVVLTSPSGRRSEPRNSRSTTRHTSPDNWSGNQPAFYGVQNVIEREGSTWGTRKVG